MNQVHLQFKKMALLFFASFRMLLVFPFIFGGSYAISANQTAGPDTAYRVSLYDYFQQNYFSAIAELLVEKEKAQDEQNHMPSELLRAGILVSYGIDQSAQKLLLELQNTDADAENKSRAAFYLGKLFYRKGLPDSAIEQFKNVNVALTDELHDELHFLSNIAMHQSGIEAQANEIVDSKIGISNDSIWSYYDKFNHAISQLSDICSNTHCEQNIESEDVEKTVYGLNRLLKNIDNSELISNSEELLALRDKVFTTLGFINLQAGNNKAAIVAFKKVRNTSPLVGQALLGYGWAASNAGDMHEALLPWQQLVLRPVHEASTKEALLAVPYALEKLSAYEQALAAYSDAAGVLEDEMALLSRLQQQVDDHEYYDFTHYLNNSALQWLNYRRLADIAQSPFKNDRQAFERLQHYQAQRQYVSISQQLADVSWLKHRLLRWLQDLDVMHYTLDERRKRAQQVIDPTYIDSLKQRHERLTTRYQKLEHNNSRETLPNERELLLLRRIHKAEQRVAKIQQQLESKKLYQAELQKFGVDEVRLAENSRLLSLMKRRLHWQIAQLHSARKWENAKLLRATKKTLDQTATALHTIAQLQLDAIEQKQHAAALVVNKQNLDRQLRIAKNIEAALQKQMRRLFRDEIEKQMAQTKIYLAQAQMAKARLMDTLSLDGDLMAQVSP